MYNLPNNDSSEWVNITNTRVEADTETSHLPPQHPPQSDNRLSTSLGKRSENPNPFASGTAESKAYEAKRQMIYAQFYHNKFYELAEDTDFAQALSTGALQKSDLLEAAAEITEDLKATGQLDSHLINAFDTINKYFIPTASADDESKAKMNQKRIFALNNINYNLSPTSKDRTLLTLSCPTLHVDMYTAKKKLVEAPKQRYKVVRNNRGGTNIFDGDFTPPEGSGGHPPLNGSGVSIYGPNCSASNMVIGGRAGVNNLINTLESQDRAERAVYSDKIREIFAETEDRSTWTKDLKL